MNPVIEYTREELKILRKIYASPETVESQAHLLPRRSFDSIEAKAHAIGLVKHRSQSILSRIHELMADRKPRTIREVEKVVGGRRKYIGEQLRLASNGIDYHIHSYTGVHRCYVFKAGPGENAVRPPPAHTPMKIYSQRFRERRRAARPMEEKGAAPVQSAPALKARATAQSVPTRRVDDATIERLKDDKYRLPANQFPQSDRTVFDAISAMARIGRVAA